MAHAALKVIRPVVTLASALAPRLSGRLAWRLFETPLGQPKLDETRPAIRDARLLFARGETRLVPHGCGFVSFTRFEPAAPARGTVLVLHGWTSRALLMAGFVAPLLEQGFRVLVPDLPAHGASSGKRLNLPIALSAIEAVVRDHLPLAGIIGHSFGAAIATTAITGGVAQFRPIPAKRLVMIAAPMGMQRYGRFFARSLGLTRRGVETFEDQVPALTGRSMASFNSAEYLRRHPMPTLVIHAPDDKEIPFAEAEALANAGPHMRLMAAEGLGHRRILNDPAVQRAAAAFIAGTAAKAGPAPELPAAIGW